MKNVFNTISKKGCVRNCYDFRNDLVHSFNDAQIKKIIYGPEINARTVINILRHGNGSGTLYSLLHDKSFIKF